MSRRKLLLIVQIIFYLIMCSSKLSANGNVNFHAEWDFILNKPHNYYIETLVETGILGLLSYLVVLVLPFRRKNKLLIPGLLGFYVTNFFGWPTVFTSLVFWVFLGFTEETS